MSASQTPAPIDISQVPKGIRYPAYYSIAFPDEGVDPHNAKLPKQLPPREPCQYPWVSDQGDGTYKNPILCADYSDPDVCRVGDDFYMTASSFSCVPGLPVLHSRDLVNWRLIAHAFDRYPNDDFNTVRHGCGIWAPAIRHHNGELFIVVGDPDNGIYMTKTSAKNPEGPWSPMHLMRKSHGWIDTCPFWDDDGNAYLVNAFSRSRTGFRNRLHLHKMTPDARELLDDGIEIFNANGPKGPDGIHQPIYTVIEGPKMYKRHGYYYIFAPGGGVSNGYQTVLRSRNIYGPYEHRIVLDRGTTPINGPHQGAWIDTQDGNDGGEHWFIHFQEVVPYGRVVHLQPMRWVDDGPVIGEVTTDPTRGQPVLHHKKPSIGTRSVSEGHADASHVFHVADSDEFDTPTLGLQWQWWTNYEKSWFSLSAHPGHLRLFPVAMKTPTRFYDRPNLLCQKFPAEIFTVTAKLDLSHLAPGESAGLILAGKTAATIYGTRRVSEGHTDSPYAKGGSITLTRTNFNLFDETHKTDMTEATATLPASAATSLYLRLRCEAHALCTLLYSTDGTTFTPLGTPITASHAMWIGAKVGLFANAPEGATAKGYADVDWIRFSP